MLSLDFAAFSGVRDDWESIMRRLTRHGPELYDGEFCRDAVTHTMSRIKNSTGRITAAVSRVKRNSGFNV